MIKVPPGARNSSWVTIDGQHQINLTQETVLRVKKGDSSIPYMCWDKKAQSNWAEKLTRTLNWNTRIVQKSLKTSYPDKAKL